MTTVVPTGTELTEAVPARSPEDLMALDSLLRPEERQWRDRTRAWVQERVLPVIEDDFDRKYFRRELVEEMGSLGVLGMHLSGYGCAGAGAVSYGLVCLELEAGDSAWRTLISVQGSLAMSAIHKHGSEEQRAHWLPQLATGRAIGCFGLTEPGAGSDPSSMTTYARRDGSDWVLDGRKRWIGLASEAAVAVIWAKTDEGIRGFLVPTDTPGFRAEDIPDKHALRASVQCDVYLDGCRLPADAVLPGAQGLRGPFGILNEARYGIVWGAMGAARSASQAALTYSLEREQFGRPIAGFQLTQAKLADMAVEYAKGVLLALHLGRRKDAGTLRPEQVSLGKLTNVREALEICRTARTVLGANGVSLEYPVIRHMANLESVLTYEGTHEVHTLVLGHALTGVRAFA